MSWFVSPAGRNVARLGALAGTIGGFCVFYLPNTFLLNKYQELTQRYRNGVPIPLPEKLKILTDEVMVDLKLSPLECSMVKLYTVLGFDIHHAGSLLTNTGGILGIPLHFRYSAIEEFETSNMRFGDEEIKWDSPEGQSLKESLILSRDAKKFAIARNLSHLSTGEPFVKGAGSASIIGACYFLASGVNKKQNFYARPVGLRIMWYSLVSMFAYTMWVFGQDFPTCTYEKDADLAAIELGENYINGGFEFYDKILQRNIALRTLMGVDGEKLFTAGGNEQVTVRTKHLPLAMRRDYLKMKVDELRKTDDTEKECTNKEL